LAQDPSLRGRLFLWRAALLVVTEHPLGGVGLGGYPAAYGQAAAKLTNGDPAAFLPLSSVDFAHNDLLQFAAEGGVLTAAAFLGVVAIALASAHRRGDPLSRAVGAALVALCVNGCVDSTLRVPSTFVLFFFLLGWLSPSALLPRGYRVLLGYRSLLGVAALLGVLQGVRFTAGNASWTRGREALRANRSAIAHLERARFWMPEHGRSRAQYARALARAGKFDRALAASDEAASLRFDFDDEIFRRDLQARSLGREAAIQLWQDFSARFPALVTPQLRLGALYLQANDRAKAILAYEAVAANPQPTRRAEAARVQARSVLRSLLSKSPAKP
jgi:tetratricopeptide (TPR) repeat protein